MIYAKQHTARQRIVRNSRLGSFGFATFSVVFRESRGWIGNDVKVGLSVEVKIVSAFCEMSCN
jgi:hypothetical protein